MKGKNVVVINGRQYDAVTGVAVPLESGKLNQVTAPVVRTKSFHDIGQGASLASAQAAQSKINISRPAVIPTAHAIHKKPQRSQTLHRAAIKKPSLLLTESAGVTVKSQQITKFGNKNSHIKSADQTGSFAPAPAGTLTRASAATVKPAFTSAKHVIAPPAQATPPSGASQSRILKERLIKEKLEHAGSQAKAHKAEHPLKKLAHSHSRLTSIATMSLAVIMLGGYLTYVNMPNLSVRVASARAGIDAQFPEYKPDGYNFSGPVAYSPGEVTINFRSNGGPQGYHIKQRASNWDSQAVLDNLITRKSSNYLTYSEQGLTIYTYGNNAAWVSGGVLYTIDGDAPLSSEQVLRIAGSM